MASNKIRPMSSLRKGARIDTVAHRKRNGYDRRNTELLADAQAAWWNLRKFRDERHTCKRFVYGDQWGDMTVYNGRVMTEREAIIAQHKVPLTNNVTRRLVNSVKGTYLRQAMEPFCTARDPEKKSSADMLTMAVQCNWQQSVTNMPTLLSEAMEEFLISGFAMSRESWEDVEDGKFDTATYIYNPDMCFFDSNMRDPLHRDMNMIGVMHDLTPYEIRTKFRITPSVWREIEHEFGGVYEGNGVQYNDYADRNRLEYVDFYTNNDPSRRRIYEIWTKEVKTEYLCIDPLRGDMFKSSDVTSPLEMYGRSIEEENADRRRQAHEAGIEDETEIPYIDYGQFAWSNGELGERELAYWYYQFLTPSGLVIDEGESPYKCGNPFTIELYPFVNGEIHSFVSDVIPQQKYINRLTTLKDMEIRSSAKGSLVVDKQTIDDDNTIEDIRRQWSDPDGVITYDGRRGGQMPRQLITTSTNIGIDRAIDMQLKLMEDISGVHGASQGKDALSGQSAALYAQQTQNAGTMLLPMLDAFRRFTRNLAVKKAKMICQYYTTDRHVNISGDIYAKDASLFSKERVRDLEYDVNISEKPYTDVARATNNQLLVSLWQAGAIDVRALLTAGEFPFSDRLMQYLDQQQQQMAQMQQGGAGERQIGAALDGQSQEVIDMLNTQKAA